MLMHPIGPLLIFSMGMVTSTRGGKAHKTGRPLALYSLRFRWEHQVPPQEQGILHWMM